MDSIIPAIGAILFGLFVGWCAGMAINSEKHFRIKHLSALIGVVAGSGIAALFGKATIAWYFLGLAPAFFLNRFLTLPAVQEAMTEAIKEAGRVPDKKEETEK